MHIKATHHVAIRTRNFAALEAFYTQTLGLPVTKRWDENTIIFINIGSTTIELIGREASPAPGAPQGGIDHIALHVDNVDSAYAELLAAGVKIKSGPAMFRDVRICFFYDPDGNILELVQEMGNQ